jgi:hypothetical protein
MVYNVSTGEAFSDLRLRQASKNSITAGITEMIMMAIMTSLKLLWI